jgi:outer membrane lipoprotein carrier protein
MRFLLCVLGLFCQAAWASPATDLVEILKPIKIYRADFAQKIFDSEGQQIAKAQGEMVVSRPDKFYWEAKKPDPILVIGDGKTLWNYDKELAQVMRQPLGEAISNSPAKLLAGDLSDVEKDFVVAAVNKKQCDNLSEKCYELKPTQKEAPISHIYLGIQKGAINVVKMHDNLGQNVITHFSNIDLNPKVNEKMFQFKVPKGVDVIEAGK